MKKLITACFCLNLLWLIGEPAKAQQTQTVGQIAGKLVAADPEETVGFASVGLFAAKDSSLVSGVLSDEAGKFLLENIPLGSYYLKITRVGFAAKKLPGLQLTKEKPNLDLGAITVGESTRKLSEVEIVAQKNVVEYGLDKQVLNVTKDLNATGGTAADALKNSPSVSVDLDGNVSVRGSSNVTVLVDGKNSGQSAQTILSQTPASAIERIEVITNPSARYDADGMGGIINIILKKEKKAGLNGNALVNLGTYDNYNTSLNLNYATGKFNFFGSHDFRQNSNQSNYHLFSLRAGNELQENQTARRLGSIHIPKIGFDYQLAKNQTLTASAKIFHNDQIEKETVHYQLLPQVGSAVFYTQHGKLDNGSDGKEFSLSYRKTFEQKKRELTASATYNQVNGRLNRFIEQQETTADQTPTGAYTRYNLLQNYRVLPLFAQVDYVHPMGETAKFETGAKHTERLLSTTYRFENLDPALNSFIKIDSLSNKMDYNEYVSAAYANYSNSWHKINYQAGIRAEQTNIRMKQPENNDQFMNNYLSLFPSVFLSREITENCKVQVNYSRRINRPNYDALNPVKNYADPYNIWSGNPKLKPEYIDSYEASYLQFWKSGSVTNTFFFRNVHNSIQQIRYVDPVNTEIAYNSYVNLNNALSYGLEISGNQELAKWWKLNGNVSGFNYKVLGMPLGVNAGSSKLSWSARLNSSFSLPKDFALQVSVNYRSPQALAQGTRDAFCYTEFALKKELLQKKASIILRVSDPFNTLRWNTSIAGDDLTYNLFSKRQSRFVYLGFSYRFGKEPEKRRRDTNNSSDGLF